MIKFIPGKLPYVPDRRDIPLKAILRKKLLPALPKGYSADEALGGVTDNRVFNNKRYGDCVIAAQAHHLLRFEKNEQGIIIPVTDDEVVREYKNQTGGPDIGLNMRESIKKWRSEGWIAGGHLHDIYSFASANIKDQEEIMYCIYLLLGIQFGMQVPQSAIDQFNAGEPWTVVSNGGGNQGGHGVYGYAYDDKWLWCMTWGARQKMDWEFVGKYWDESYGCVDNRDAWLGEDSPVDVELNDSYLQEITKGRGEVESSCSFANTIVNGLNKAAKWSHKDTRIPHPMKRMPWE